MKKIVLTVIATLVVFIVIFFVYITSGSYDVSQLSPHNKLTKALIDITRESSISKRSKGIEVPADLKDSAVIISGFKHYNQMCVGCHSAPGQKQWEGIKGWYPKPPELYKYAKEDDAKEFFWIIKNGIKLTSMPAFAPTHDDGKIWAMDAFVTQKLGKMSPQEYNAWVKKYAGKGDDNNDSNTSK